MGCSRIKPNRGVEDILFWNPPWNFSLLYFTSGNSRQNKVPPWIFHKIVLDPLEIPMPKTKTPGNSTLFLLATLGNSTLFLIKPWKFHMLFLWYPWKFHIIFSYLQLLDIMKIAEQHWKRPSWIRSINPWNFHMLASYFYNTPGKSMSSS